MDINTLFARLALRPDANERDVRRAYALELKKIDQELQPEVFQQLRETYDALLAWLQRQKEVQPDRPQPQQQQPQPEPEQQMPADAAAPLHQAASQEDLAREVLQTLVHRFEHRPFTDHNACAAFLAGSLEDPRLAHVDARRYFEWGVASILAGGWRPGHELLFAPATECFGWRQDRTRLLWLGHAGHLLDAAIAELGMFDGQPGSDRYVQRDVIRAMRSGAKRSSAELVKELPIAEFLLATFPNWLHVVSRPQTVQAWRANHSPVPGWRRKVVLTFRVGAKSLNHYARRILGWLFFAMLVFAALSTLTLGPPPFTHADRDDPAARQPR